MEYAKDISETSKVIELSSSLGITGSSIIVDSYDKDTFVFFLISL